MQVLAVVRKRGRPASEVCHRFEPVPQVLRNVRFKGSRRSLGAGSRIAIEAERVRAG